VAAASAVRSRARIEFASVAIDMDAGYTPFVTFESPFLPSMIATFLTADRAL
jgi:hypothetical protein